MQFPNYKISITLFVLFLIHWEIKAKELTIDSCKEYYISPNKKFNLIIPKKLSTGRSICILKIPSKDSEIPDSPVSYDKNDFYSLAPGEKLYITFYNGDVLCGSLDECVAEVIIYTDPRERSITGGFFFVEQDYFNAQYNKDQNYTAGTAIGLSGRITNSPFFLLIPSVRRTLDNASGITSLRMDDGLAIHSFSIGLSGFTPENLRDSTVVSNDRPYSSFLFISSKFTSIKYVTQGTEQVANRSLTSEFTFGLLGLQIAREIQSSIHRDMRQKDSGARPIPMGWHNQISNSKFGEPTLLYKLSYNKRLAEINGNCGSKLFQMGGLMEGSAGYYTNFAVGTTLKAGFIRSAFWEDASNFGSSYNQKSPCCPENICPKFFRHFEFYGFVSARHRAIIWNAHLQGQFYPSNHRLAWNEVNHFVYEFETGFVARFFNVLSLMYIPLAGRSAEFNSDLARTHIWGSIYGSFRLPL